MTPVIKRVQLFDWQIILDTFLPNEDVKKERQRRDSAMIKFPIIGSRKHSNSLDVPHLETRLDKFLDQYLYQLHNTSYTAKK